MSSDGSVVRTPEELDVWISRQPNIQAVLERGGYGTKFTSADLLPLLEVFLAQEERAPPPEAAPPRGTNRRWLMAIIVVVLVVLLVLALL